MSYIGRIPNVYWSSFSDAQIAAHPLFVPLANIPSEKYDPEISSRLYRQHTPAWDELHRGRVTTSSLLAICGMYEENALKSLKIPKSFASHSKVLDIIDSLIESAPRIQPGTLENRSKDGSLVENIGLRKVTPNELNHKSIVVSEQDDVLRPPVVITSSGNIKHWARNKDFCSIHTGIRINTSPNSESNSPGDSIGSPLGSPFPYLLDSPLDPEVRDSAQSLRLSDTLSTRLLWGRVQENTGILTAINALLAGDGEAACSGGKPCTASPIGNGNNSGESSQDADSRAENVCGSALSSHSNDLPSDNDSDEAHRYVTPSRYFEIGCCISEDLQKLVDSEGNFQDAGRSGPQAIPEDIRTLPLPPLGATPDGVIVRANGEVEVVEIKCHSPFALLDQTLSGTRRSQLYQNTAAFQKMFPVGSGGMVKASDLGKNPSFTIRDDGPPTHLPPYHVLQLQLEMYLVGPYCKQGHLVFLTATKGARIFTVARDEELIKCMLRVISCVYSNFVLPCKSPDAPLEKCQSLGSTSTDIGKGAKEQLTSTKSSLLVGPSNSYKGNTVAEGYPSIKPSGLPEQAKMKMQAVASSHVSSNIKKGKSNSSRTVGPTRYAPSPNFGKYIPGQAKLVQLCINCAQKSVATFTLSHLEVQRSMHLQSFFLDPVLTRSDES